MANEKRGLMAEAIVHRALERAVKESGNIDQVFWNKKPSGMSVTPDLTVGQDPNDPKQILLITASGAEHNSHMKFMRNVGEVFEAKVQLPQETQVHSIYALSKQKEKVRNLMDLLTDSSIHVDDDGPTAYISQWIEAPVTVNVKDREARLAFVDTALQTDRRLNDAFDGLVKLLKTSLGKTNTDLAQLWALMREDYQKALKSLDSNPLPQPRQTFVRRGIGKLMVMDKDTRKAVYDSLQKGEAIKDEVPAYALQLGFLHRTLGGTRLQDDEIRNVIELLGSDSCENLLKHSLPGTAAWIDELRNLGDTEAFGNFILNNLDSLADSNYLFNALNACHKDPSCYAKSVGITPSGNLGRVWLFTSIMDLIKASTGRKTGYGYAQLSADIGESVQVSSGYIEIADWANRIGTTKITREVLQKVSKALSARLSEMDRSQLATILEDFKRTSIKSILEDRVIPYRKFEPLINLLTQAAAAHGVRLSPKENFTGWISEYADSGRAVATTPFIRLADTLIHWKSVSDAGKGHKVKELSARARIIKYQYDPQTGQFARRPEAQRLVLIADGTFDEKDLLVLRLAGWDEIVYPDEISKLFTK